jgi:hypothetical protein
MDRSKKDEINKKARDLFECYFIKGMVNKDVKKFREDYKTLYSNVIIPIIESLIEKQVEFDVDHMSIQVKTVYKLINYQNSEFEWNDKLRDARKILNSIQSELKK